MKTVGIEFKKNGKQYILSIGDNVIIDTERGLQFGCVSSLINKEDNIDHSKVVKIASKTDEKI